MAVSKYMSMFLKDEKNLLASEFIMPQRLVLPSPSLNHALGGGLTFGNTVCYYGPEQGGKSLLTMLGIGALHQSDPNALAVLVTSEFRVPSPERVRQLGVDPNRLLVRQANTLHDTFDWLVAEDSQFVNSDTSKGGPGLVWMLKDGAPIRSVVVDSIKAIRGPKEQASESSEKDIMGDLSKYLNPALKAYLPVIRQYKLANMFVQQVNENMNPDEVKYQNIKWKVPNGQALKHFCEHMVLVERVTSKDSKLFSDDKMSMRDLPLQEGHTIRCRVEKANLDIPFQEAEFRINYRKGLVDTGLEVAKLAAGLGMIYHPKNDKGGEIVAQWCIDLPGGQKKWIGWDNMVKDLEENPEIQREVMARVYSR